MKRWHIIVLVMIVVAWFYIQLARDVLQGSTYSSAAHGVRAFFVFLEQMNIRTKPWLYPFDELDPSKHSGTLFIVDVNSPSGIEALKDWVASGNKVVVMGGNTWEFVSVLFDDSPERTVQSKNSCIIDSQDNESSQNQTCVPEQTSDSNTENSITEGLEYLREMFFSQNKTSSVKCSAELQDTVCLGVKEVSWMSGWLPSDRNMANSGWQSSKEHDSITIEAAIESMINKKGIDIVAASMEIPTIMKKQIGFGEVWIFSSSSPIQNREISKYDNLRFLYQIAVSNDLLEGAVEGTNPTVYFDEFHHGFFAPVEEHMEHRYLSLIVVLGYISLCIIVWGCSRAVRFGPPTPELHEEQSSTVEFVSAVGLLYREHNATSVLTHYLELVKERIAQTYKTRAGVMANSEMFVAELLQKGIISKNEILHVERAIQTLSNPAVANEKDIIESFLTLETL